MDNTAFLSDQSQIVRGSCGQSSQSALRREKRLLFLGSRSPRMRNMHDTIAIVMICEWIRTFLGLRSKRGLGLKGRVAVLGPLLIVVKLGRSAALHGWRGRGGSTWASDLDLDPDLDRGICSMTRLNRVSRSKADSQETNLTRSSPLPDLLPPYVSSLGQVLIIAILALLHLLTIILIAAPALLRPLISISLIVIRVFFG